MATTTYVPIQTYTLTGLTTTVTFSSIPDTYTDLRLVCSYKLGSAATGTNSFVRLNGDTGTNYSNTQVIGTGSSTPAGSTANSNNMGVTVDVTADYPVYQWDFQNYANTTTYKTALLRQSAGNNQAAAGVYLWRNTNAINQITFTAADNSGGSSGTPDQFAAGSTFTLYGIANAQIEAPKATGGIITYDNTYYYHTFGASGTFTPQQSLTADILVVAGGGGGGSNLASGGGAGGLLGFASQSLSATGYTVTIGSGGNGAANGSSNPGSVGGDSQFGALTLVKGGGYGGGYLSQTGGPGGSGGGGSSSGSGSGGNGGAATSGQGNNGGSWVSGFSAGGGGGAGAAGTNGTGVLGAAGGVGSSAYSSWGLVTGTGQNVSGTVYYAGGGGGTGNASTDATNIGFGGYGGGGLGAPANGNIGVAGGNGLTNTGGGGGGGGTGAGAGGNGGSGIVIIRYLKA